MARYKDVEGYRKLFDEEYKKTRKLISEGETHLDNLAEGFSEASRVIDRMSTADVAPKSEVAMEFIEIINDRIDNIRARIPYGGRAQGKTLSVEKMRLLESLKVEIAKKYTEERE